MKVNPLTSESFCFGLTSEFTNANRLWRIRPRAARWVFAAPLFITAIYAMLLCFRSTQVMIEVMSDENRPVELLTVFLFFAGGLLCFRIAHTRRDRLVSHSRVFYFVMAAGLLLVGLEEVSWTQTFFQFATPEWIKKINAQGEFTLHNIGVLQSKSEFLQITFGIGGLIGIILRMQDRLAQINAPLLLSSWFLLIVTLGTIGLLEDFSVIENPVNGMIEWVNELNELFVAASAFLFVWLKQSELSAPRSSAHALPANSSVDNAQP